MKFNPKLLECLFGHHDCDEESVKDKDGFDVHLCKICGRSGYWTWRGRKVWYGYDEKGNCLYIKNVQGKEYRRVKNGEWKDAEGGKASFISP